MIVGAVDIVDDRVLWHGLREGHIDALRLPSPASKLVIDDFLGAFFPADAAAGAIFCLDVAGASS